ncbi:hypothetical protein Glove_772g14 [Diversispora epigaea]|uniref:F-box domain-containing protein n=1 Tax=Diversispora epigaea TaxID=1348612 RepID=A0A397G2D3_9GLOM|nr:hypothetical protein Glove_772g14 [Diversispora epigaea]
MHTYNPLILPDIIAEIVQKLSLENLGIVCWINRTWYKEIQHELRKRWEIQVLKGHKLELKKDEELRGYFDGGIELKYYAKLLETAKKQVEIERCMLINGMLYGQEREIVKYNI